MQDLALSDGLVAFMESGISIVVAGRDADGFPVTGRALACRVSGDRRRLTLLVPGEASAAVVGAVRANGALAVAFTEPTTHRSLQFKATDATVRPVAAEERPLLAHHARLFAREVGRIGFDERFVRVFLEAPSETVVALVLTPTQGFDQTPGPQAGGALDPDGGVPWPA